MLLTKCNRRIYMTKSMLDIAYDYVVEQKNEVSFSDIWNHIVKTLDLSDSEAEAKVARFYTNLMLDGRFVDLGDNVWDLRSKHTFDKVHIDMNDVYSEVEEEEEEDEEEEEYEEVFAVKEPTAVDEVKQEEDQDAEEGTAERY